ncbi:MAG TPA: NUDIX hydrolase [Salinimicrobium sp.]|nr:NUDIX hydrolase [Salinimicrobium sp.]
MYKVFVNDTAIILSTAKELDKKYTSVPVKYANIKKIIKDVDKGKLNFVNLYHKKEKKLFKHLLKKLPLVSAGGGLVFNDKNEILFIHRKGKWDLPKGKIEDGESIEETALREVEEETGVQGLEITKFLRKTYHIFHRGGKYKLKVTHWFEMRTSYTGLLKPETSEGIKKAKWKNSEKAEKALANSYANIKLLFPENELAGHPKNGIP